MNVAIRHFYIPGESFSDQLRLYWTCCITCALNPVVCTVPNISRLVVILFDNCPPTGRYFTVGVARLSVHKADMRVEQAKSDKQIFAR